jgi:hypothetical protein
MPPPSLPHRVPAALPRPPRIVCAAAAAAAAAAQCVRSFDYLAAVDTTTSLLLNMLRQVIANPDAME